MSTFVPRPPLRLEELHPDPLAQFDLWFQEALNRSGLSYPNAVVLSTLDPEGWPEGRVVLLKGVEDEGFVFYTNRESAKGRALEATPLAAMVFYWESLARQIRVQGAVERVADEVSDAYFASRPRGSQIGAWASAQSRPLDSRELLESRFQALEEEYATGPVPRPPYWGGYKVVPRTVEFWQEAASRLHDRIQYHRTGAGAWTITRLNP